MTKELAKTLTTALVQFIDEQRPEGAMCCSNTECESIEEMFEGECFDIIEAFIQKKLSRLTEFEKALAELVNDVLAKEPQNPFVWIIGSRWAEKLLAIAKKEILKDDELAKKHLDGYIMGREGTMREVSDFLHTHFNTDSGTSTLKEEG